MTPLIALLAVAPGDDMHLPPLIGGREVVVQLSAGELGSGDRGASRVVRYEALWDVTIHVEAWTEEEFGVYLELLDPAEQVIARDAEREGSTICILERSLQAGDSVQVRFGCASPDGVGTMRVAVLEDPDLATWLDRAEIRAPPPAPADLALRLEPARRAVRKASALARSGSRLRCFMAVGKALALLRSVAGAECHESGVQLHWELAGAAGECANHEVSAEAIERILPYYERTLRADHPTRLRARALRSTLLSRLGDQARALAEIREVLVLREKLLAEGHPDLMAARRQYANCLSRIGDHPASRELWREILRTLEEVRPEGRQPIANAQVMLASELQWFGEVQEARELFEAAHASLEEVSTPDDPQLLGARMLLGNVLREMGDLTTARALQESVVASLSESLPAIHPSVLWARGALAVTLRDLGELEAAHDTLESVLGLAAMVRPDDHWDIQIGRIHLAITKRLMGDLEGAQELLEKIIEVLEDDEYTDRTELLWAWGNLAGVIKSKGDLADARDLMGHMIGQIARTVPDDHYALAEARRAQAFILDGLGDGDALGGILSDILRGAQGRLRSSLALAPREAAALGRSLDPDVSTVLSLALRVQGSEELAAGTFELIETIRSVPGFRSGVGRTDDPVLARTRARALQARQRLNDLVAGMGLAEEKDDLTIAAVVRATRERDLAERALDEDLRRRGAPRLRVTVESLAAALPEGAAAVAYRVYERRWPQPEAPHRTESEQALVAHVLRSDRTLTRIDLGAMKSVAERVDRWRSAIGKPLVRGVRVSEEGDADPASEGEALRAAILDPVLAEAGDASTLFVCLDGALHLVPLDALPLAEGVVGDRVRLHLVGSFRSLIDPPEPARGEPALLALGGIDFDVVDEFPGGARRRPAVASLVPAVADRSGPGGRAFVPLPQTRYEVEGLQELFRRSFEREATVLTDTQASCEALHRLSPGKRYIHLATHGYFAEEVLGVKALGGGEDWFVAPLGVGRAVSDLAPLALCGLALAGANMGRDEVGRVRGILTGEEIVGLDLGSCELAVLSACETNVGISWAGLGIQSLQTALHAAGARTVLTSLWMVDDEASRTLMVDFYRRVWRLGTPKAQALWEAKEALRARGRPVKDWAAWVLTGDPR